MGLSGILGSPITPGADVAAQGLGPGLNPDLGAHALCVPSRSLQLDVEKSPAIAPIISEETARLPVVRDGEIEIPVSIQIKTHGAVIVNLVAYHAGQITLGSG
jgi:hypothetical protein